MQYKVCITAAGIGTRISKISSINKALLPVGYESILTKIINKFPKKIEIVIAVGYQKEKVIDFLRISHSDRKIKIVKVDNGLTKKQLKRWDVKYHRLLFGKPVFDVYIDDKNFEFKKNWHKAFNRKLLKQV